MSKDSLSNSSDIAHSVIYIIATAALLIFIFLLLQLILGDFNSTNLASIATALTAALTAVIAYSNYKSASLTRNVLRNAIIDKSFSERKALCSTLIKVGITFNELHQNNRLIILDICCLMDPIKYTVDLEEKINKSKVIFEEIEESVSKSFELIEFFKMTLNELEENKLNELGRLLAELINALRREQKSFNELVNRIKSSPNKQIIFSGKNSEKFTIEPYLYDKEKPLFLDSPAALIIDAKNKDENQPYLMVYDETVKHYLKKISEAIEKSNSSNTPVFTKNIQITEDTTFERFENLYKDLLKNDIFQKI